MTMTPGMFGFGGGMPSSGGGGGLGGLWQGLGDQGQASVLGGLFQLGGGILGGIGQGKLNDKQIALQREQMMRGEQLSRDQMGQQAQVAGLNASQMNPLAAQEARQHQALMAAILPELRNASVSSPIPGFNAFIPQISGGLRLPEGGFNAETLGYFSPEARANAEGAFYKTAAPFSPPPDLAKVGYGQAGVAPTQGAQGAYDKAQGERQARQTALMQALQQGVKEKSSGGGGKSKLGGVASGAAQGALAGSFIPGIGNLAGAGVGALLGGIGGLFR